MRRFICALAMVALSSSAFAGDFDVLRGMQSVGPANFYNWSGFYVGGQIGYGDANGDFSSATSPLISYALRDTALESSFAPSGWPMLGTADNHRTLYGGFAGYNTQWQDLILGIEGNYAQSQYGLIAPSTPISRLTPADSNGNTWLVNMTSSGTVTNLNYGTLRGRAGVVLGNFLPYGFAGLAIGEAAMNISVYGAGEENPPTSGACSSSATPPCSLFAFSKTTAETAVLYGFAVGGGMDVAITRNIFVRAEFEYVRFAPIMNTVLAVESARVGAGLKF